MHSISRRLFIYCKNNKLRFLIDTGADISVIPYNSKFHKNKNTSFTLNAANGGIINTFGTKFLNVDVGLRRNFPFTFTIADIKQTDYRCRLFNPF